MSAQDKQSNEVLWDQLLDVTTLERGWHICRTELHRDFSENLLADQVVAHDLPKFLTEISNSLYSNTYRPDPLFNVEVPKGLLGFRPGSTPSIKDRVVLCAIILLIAERLDPQLPDGVWSFRLKNPIPQKGPIFPEHDQTIQHPPFLKKKTIARLIDPFESWYRAWPHFDVESRKQFEILGFDFMATSDIAAYFENIQIPILRDLLITALGGESRVVNLLCLFLETWSIPTHDGRPRFRGIPQGTMVTSFLGNIFLLPLDSEFTALEHKSAIKYFRYQDDVRIFSSSYGEARNAILLLTRTLRKLHLNVQTAKTRIYSEKPHKEISNFLVDPRIDAVNSVIEKFEESSTRFYENGTAERELAEIARQDPTNGQKISGSTRPLEGLSMRLFLRWVHAHIVIESPRCVRPLLREIERNSDSRLIRKLGPLIKTFPRHSSIGNRILAMVDGEKLVFPYQIAECFRVMRYASRVPSPMLALARNYLHKNDADPYLRMESAYLLARTTRRPNELEKMRRAFFIEKNEYVKVAMSLVTVQSRPNQPVIRDLVLHQNERVRHVGKYFRTLKNDVGKACDAMRSIFDNELPWVLCDRMPILYAIAQSNEKKVLKKLIANTSSTRCRRHPLMDIRQALRDIEKVATRRLS